MEGQQEFDKRISRVRQAMRDKGLQTLLVYDSGRHNFLRMNYVAYLTDFISVGPETMLIRSVGRYADALSFAGVGYPAGARRIVGFRMFIRSIRILVVSAELISEGRTDRPGGDARQST